MKKNLIVSLLATAGVFAAGAASAAVDASVSTAFTAVQADAVSMAGIVTPIVVAVLGLALGIKLIKRFGNKI